MPLEIVLNDITKMEVDAIVNAANIALRMGGDVCGAIFQAAGARELQQEWDALGGRCETGQAVITRRYALPARYIIHTVGSVWRGGGHGEAELLRSCYLNSLQLAQDYQCESIAFPLISSGIYGYPRAEALKIAITAIGDFLSQTDMDVYLLTGWKMPVGSIPMPRCAKWWNTKKQSTVGSLFFWAPTLTRWKLPGVLA